VPRENLAIVSGLGKNHSMTRYKEPLSVTYPEIAKQAVGWDPSLVTAGSNQKKLWKCEINHVWEASIDSRSRGRGCPVCAGTQILAGHNDLLTTHPGIAAQAHGWDPSLVGAGSHKEKEWMCDLGHKWNARVEKRSIGRGCPVCAGKKVLPGFNDLETKNPELASEAFGWDPTAMHFGSHTKKEWMCPLNHKWFAPVGNRSAGYGCPICAGKRVLPGFNDLASVNPDLAIEAYGWDPTTVTKSSDKKMSWVCKLGHVWETAISNRYVGNGCPVCAGKTVRAGFNDLATSNPTLASEASGWDPKTVTRGSGEKKEWVCSLGHKWVAPVTSRDRGNGCPICAGKVVLRGFNDLASSNSHLAEEAFGWDPSTEHFGSHLKKEWKCKLDHMWSATVGKRNLGSGCPVCSGNVVLAGFNDLATLSPELASEAFGWDPKTVSRSTHLVKDWKCQLDHVWRASVNSRDAGNGCPRCATSGFNPDKSGWLYFLSHSTWGMFQIGITNVPNERLKSHRRLGWEVLEIRGPMDGHLTQQWEAAILKMLKAKGADLSNSKIAGKFDGYSEAWSQDTFRTNSIKELMKFTEEFEENK